MKKIYFVFWCSIIGLCTLAQNNNRNDDYHPLVQEGKVWSVVFVTGDIWNYHFTTTQMAFFGDTTINGIPYKKMYASTKEYPEFPQDWTLQNFMREDENKKVWFKDKNSSSIEKLYYDFSVQVGDTLPDNLGLPTPTNESVIVDSISSITLLSGEECKVWYLSIMCYGFPNHEYWIEGIGSSLGIINPLGGQLVGGFDRLLCVHKNETLVYNANLWNGKCYIRGSNGIDGYDNPISIYPNPANHVIYIKSTDHLDFQSISIINMQGQVVQEYAPDSTLLDISGITTGFYFVKITTKEGITAKKIIKY
jgi:hypothetical protein